MCIGLEVLGWSAKVWCHLCLSLLSPKVQKPAKMQKILSSRFLLCRAGNQAFITRIRDCSGHSGTVMWSLIKMQTADEPAALTLGARSQQTMIQACAAVGRKHVFITPVIEFD